MPMDPRDKLIEEVKRALTKSEDWTALKAIMIVRDALKEYEDNEDKQIAKFLDGAEQFRKTLLLSINPVVWPHIEGVFQVFADEYGFIPKDILDDVVKERG